MRTILSLRIDGRVEAKKFFNKQNLYLLALEFKLADFWVGAYWAKDGRVRDFDLWICLIPCFPIHFAIIANDKRNSTPLNTL